MIDKLKSISLIILLAGLGIAGWLAVVTFSNDEQVEFSNLNLSGTYSLSDVNKDEGDLARIYQLTYNNASQSILSLDEINNDDLNSGWRAEQQIELPVPPNFETSQIKVVDSVALLFDSAAQRVILANLEESTIKQIDLGDNHPNILTAKISDQKLIIIIDQFLEGEGILVERTVDLDSYQYSDKAIEIDLGNKVPLDALSSDQNTSITSTAEISRRALDVWELEKGNSNPIVLAAVNGDYIVADNDNKLGVVTFGGDYLAAFKDDETNYLILQ